MSNLCDLGAGLLAGSRWDDPSSYRLSMDGQPRRPDVRHLHVLGGDHGRGRLGDQAPRATCRSRRPACSGCGVGTGWGSAVNSAEVSPGDTVIVMGIGGIGINAVQGAAHAGASHVIAVDPVAFKRAEGRGVRGHARRGDDGGGDRDRPVLHQRPGRRLRDHHRGRHQGRAPRAGVGLDPQGRHRRGHRARQHRGGRGRRCRSPTSRCSRSASRARCSAPRTPGRTSSRCSSCTSRGSSSSTSWSTRTYKLDEIAQGYEDMHAGTNLRGVILY